MGQIKELGMEEQQRQLTPAKKSIYNIQNSHLLLMQQIEDAEGEITEEIGEQLAINEKELQEKAVSYGYVIRQYDFEIDQISQEIARLSAISASKAKIKDELKSRIYEAMLKFNIIKIDQSNLKLSFRKSERLVIDEGTHIPVEYITTKEVETVDKAGLKKAIKEGAEFTGMRIDEVQNLQIK